MNASQILSVFPSLSALVVGDICLDRWCTYDPATAEPSRETGIPRIGVVRTEVTPGAGGTVANNLAALGVGRIAVLGAVGDDSETGVEDCPRLDFIATQPLPLWAEQRIVEALRTLAPQYDVILVADQAETDHGGVVSGAVRQALAACAAEAPRKIVWVDSRQRCDLFRRAIVKPNQQEAEAACQRLFGRVDYQALRRHVDTGLLLVTHGGDGVLLVTEAGEEWVKTRKVENPVDICGAGDSFTAGAAMALAACGSPADAARFGNLVASITIMKKGTGTASPAEVLEKAHANPGD
jgi:bifunctional ADP-heptose synthase (sugar kinase/adenylyltransferase)